MEYGGESDSFPRRLRITRGSARGGRAGDDGKGEDVVILLHFSGHTHLTLRSLSGGEYLCLDFLFEKKKVCSLIRAGVRRGRLQLETGVAVRTCIQFCNV